MMKKIMVLACILSLLVSAVALVGCGSGGSSSGTPEGVEAEEAVPALPRAWQRPSGRRRLEGRAPL